MVNNKVRVIKEIYKVRESYSKNRHSETLHRYNRVEQLIKLRHKFNIELSKMKDVIATKRFDEKLTLIEKYIQKATRK